MQGRTAGMRAERPTRRIVRQEIERDTLLASAWAQHRRVPQVPVLAYGVQPHGHEFVGLIADGHEDVGITGALRQLWSAEPAHQPRPEPREASSHLDAS
jgi:hypothetical protein